MAKDYKSFDRSTPEKRGYATRKAFFEDSNGGASSSDDIKNMYGTSPEQNIGPRMDAEGVPAKGPAYAGDKDAKASKQRGGEWQKGFDKAKAEEQAPMGPSYKKGGFVHAKDAIAKHSSGFKHHMDGMKQHAAGFKSHIDHVKSMCGGGMTKGKR